MGGKGYRLEVSLEFETRLLDEPLIFWIVRNRRQRAGTDPPEPAKVGVKKGVSPGQKPRRFRRSALSQLDGDRQRGGHNHDRQSDGQSASNSHEIGSGVNDSTGGQVRQVSDHLPGSGLSDVSNLVRQR